MAIVPGEAVGSGWLRALWALVRRAAGQTGGVSISGTVGSVAGDIVGGNKGLDEEGVRAVLRDELSALAKAKGVPEAPLRAVLRKLGETRVPRAEIPARLAAAADELIRLRADLARLHDDRPEFAEIRARAFTLIDRGEFDAARAVLREGREAARALREELSRSEAGFLVDEARVNRLQLDHAAARANLAEATRLDPDNCWAWIELGELRLLLGSLSEAEEAFRAALGAAIRNGNERDLSVSHEKIGDVQVEPGDLAAALRSYQASLAIRDRLARADPGNAGWQRDLSVSHEKIGDVQRARGETSQAIAAFERALNICREAQRRNPDDVQARLFSVVPLWRLGRLKGKEGRTDLEAALAILKPLAAADRLDHDRRSWPCDREAVRNGHRPRAPRFRS
jgi:tetratricopeptide (TPR) repeat protein